MAISEKSGCWVPFPYIPESSKKEYAIDDLFLRPFGLFENDLEIDFNREHPPYLVTEVLACCTRDQNGQHPETAFFWDLTVGKRIECVLAIVLSGRDSKLPIHLRCLNPTCQELMEIEISRQDMATLQDRSDAANLFDIQIDGKMLQLRKPTGRDQLNWLQDTFPDENSAIKKMIQTMWSDAEKTGSEHEYRIPDGWIQTIDDAMADIDPLVNFNLTTRCPHCDEDRLHSVNLEACLLRELHKAQEYLFETLHRLAAHYHWSEQQILSIPPWRRFHYLTLIEQEKA